MWAVQCLPLQSAHNPAYSCLPELAQLASPHRCTLLPFADHPWHGGKLSYRDMIGWKVEHDQDLFCQFYQRWMIYVLPESYSCKPYWGKREMLRPLLLYEQQDLAEVWHWWLSLACGACALGTCSRLKRLATISAHKQWMMRNARACLKVHTGPGLLP
jgi:hypothetical protein